jgi:transcriptional regulator with XRE-family HTH domain
VDAAAAIRLARHRAGLSKRALARRAGTSPAAIVLYESGAREPTLPTLRRIVAAAGGRAELTLEAPRAAPSPDVAAQRLLDLLELAEHLPQRRAPRRLSFPPLPR